MALHHTRRVWDLPLPSTERFVLMSLADHANDDELSWPSNERISARTGFCVKTVSRAIAKLKKLGLITIDKSNKFNRYKLHINSELQYLVGYLKFKLNENMGGTKEHGSLEKNSKSGKVYNITDAVKGFDFKKNIEDYAKAPHWVKPSEAKAPYEDIWYDCMSKAYKGWKGQLSEKDKWNLNEIQSKLQDWPADIIILMTVSYWHKFCNEVMDENKKLKYLKLNLALPSTEFLLRNIELAKPFAMQLYELFNE